MLFYTLGEFSDLQLDVSLSFFLSKFGFVKGFNLCERLGSFSCQDFSLLPFSEFDSEQFVSRDIAWVRQPGS